MSDNNENPEPIDIKTLIEQAPDLFCASEQFLAIEKNLEEALKS